MFCKDTSLFLFGHGSENLLTNSPRLENTSPSQLFSGQAPSDRRDHFAQGPDQLEEDRERAAAAGQGEAGEGGQGENLRRIEKRSQTIYLNTEIKAVLYYFPINLCSSSFLNSSRPKIHHFLPPPLSITGPSLCPRFAPERDPPEASPCPASGRVPLSVRTSLLLLFYISLYACAFVS